MTRALRKWICMSLVVALLAGCIGNEGDEYGPGLDPWDETWTATLDAEVAGRDLQPGEWLDIAVSTHGESPEQVFIWLENGAAVEVTEFLAEPDDYSQLAVRQLQPYITEGSHYFALGTAAGPKSNRIDFEVIVPQPEYTREQVAELIWWGMDEMFSTMRPYTSTGEDMEAFALSYHGYQGVEALSSHYRAFKEIAKVAGESYLDIPEEIEPGVQAMLKNSGLLPMFADAARADVALARGAALPNPFGDRPVHAALFQLDFASMGIAVAMKVADNASLLLIATGVGAPAGAEIQVVKLGLAAFVILVESVLPTDIVGMQIYGQDTYVNNVRMPRQVWGTMSPQKPLVDGMKFSITTVLGKLTGAITKKLLPVDLSASEKIIKAALDKVVGAMNSVGATQALEAMLPAGFKDLKSYQAKVLLDMRLYNVSLLDMLGFLPWMARPLFAMENDNPLVVWKSVELNTDNAPAFASSAKLDVGADDVTFTGAGTWTQPAIVQIETRAYAWKTTGFEPLEGIAWAVDKVDPIGHIMESNGKALIVVLGKNNPIARFGNWVSTTYTDVRDTVIKGAFVRPSIEFVEATEAPLVLPALEVRAGDWQFLGHQHLAEIEWRMLEGTNVPLIPALGFIIDGIVLKFTPNARPAWMRLSLANPQSEAITVDVYAGPDAGSLIRIQAGVVVSQAGTQVGLPLSPGQNIVRLVGTYGGDTAVHAGLGDKTKHIRLAQGVSFDYKIYAPPAL